MKLTEEKQNINFVTFVKILKKYNLYTESLQSDDEFNNKIKLAPSHTLEESGGAYDGALIEHINVIASFARKINDNILSPDDKIDNNALIKTCFLHQIGKAIQYVKNDTDWAIKQGRFYKFADGLPALKTGELSIMLCNKYNIDLTEEEFESILSIDKEDDNQTKLHGNMLSKVLKMAIELANIEQKKNLKK